MITDKQKQLVNDFYETLNETNEKLIFNEIIDFLLELGYKPIKCKTSDFCLDFYHSKLKQKIVKIRRNELKLKFYACEEYSMKFSNAIKSVIEEFNGKYTGCYGCGKCKGSLRGYTYIYPNGRKVFRCGSELIAIPDIIQEDLDEIKQLINVQHEFFISMF
ncbi:hypothetical protein R0131_16240 [Clostridium sp. AL.422]|uniref:hypothetical protein n=1 Tax=Clostridium TaxID=1485 RepID=UPI00293DA58C|nr:MULTISPECIES: hypothetical protein [unclassified Clostridium]MDV4152377.1 hypothetical protein [Clostridium sp. AL.422]